MTTDLATTTTTLPARPLGPGAVAWYAASDQRMLLLAVRALVLQVAHPMVGAGVAAHSVYKTDPYGRLWRTTLSVLDQVFGGVRSAEEGQRLVRMHAEIRGHDASGRRYSALDPGAYLWVHATMFETWRLFLREYGPGLTAAQEDQLFDEWHRMGLLIGVRPRVMPASVAEFDAYWSEMIPTLENNEVVQDLLYYAPGPAWLTRSLLRRQRAVVAETLDAGLVARIGLRRTSATAATRRRVRRVARLLGHLPRPLLQNPFALRAMRRTAHDPRTLPEPVSYPAGAPA